MTALAFAFHNKFKQGPLLSVVRWRPLEFFKCDKKITVLLTYYFQFDNAVLEQRLVLHIPSDTPLPLTICWTLVWRFALRDLYLISSFQAIYMCTL